MRIRRQMRPAVESLEGRVALSGVSAGVAAHQGAEHASPFGLSVIVKNINSVFVRVNQHFAQGLGVTPAQVVGKTDYNFYPASLAAKYIADDQSVLASRKPRLIVEPNLIDGVIETVVTKKIPLIIKSGPARGTETGLLILSRVQPTAGNRTHP
jgi:hypothetical protein